MNVLELLSLDSTTKKHGYAALCELALKTFSKDKKTVPLTPNNILGIEYIKAILLTNSSIKVHTIQRTNNSFSEEEFVPGSIQSATAIRASIENKDISALEFIPNITKNIIIHKMIIGMYVDGFISSSFPRTVSLALCRG